MRLKNESGIFHYPAPPRPRAQGESLRLARFIAGCAKLPGVYNSRRSSYLGTKHMTVRGRASATAAAERTMTKFLNATEYLFGKHGYEGTTIRAIAAKAHVNLGTLKHYWGSKRELFRALFERRFRPMQEEHMRRLRELEHPRHSGRSVMYRGTLLSPGPSSSVDSKVSARHPATFVTGQEDRTGRNVFRSAVAMTQHQLL